MSHGLNKGPGWWRYDFNRIKVHYWWLSSSAALSCQQPRPAFKAFCSSISIHIMWTNDMIWRKGIVVCKVQRLGISMINNWTSSLREILQPLALSAAGQKFTSEENVRQLVHPLLPSCPHLPSDGLPDTEKWEKSWTALFKSLPALVCCLKAPLFSLGHACK